MQSEKAHESLLTKTHQFLIPFSGFYLVLCNLLKRTWFREWINMILSGCFSFTVYRFNPHPKKWTPPFFVDTEVGPGLPDRGAKLLGEWDRNPKTQQRRRVGERLSNVKFSARFESRKYFGFFLQKLGFYCHKFEKLRFFIEENLDFCWRQFENMGFLRNIGKFWVFILESALSKSKLKQIVWKIDCRLVYIPVYYRTD